MNSVFSRFGDLDFGELPAFPSDYDSAALPITKEHPRVYVNRETLTDLKAKLTCDENAEQYSALMSTAEEALANDIPPADDAELFKSLAYAEDLAFLYLVTGDKKYGTKALQYAFNYITVLSEIAFDPNADEAVLLKITRQSGHAMHIFGEVYDWCFDLFTDTQRTQFINGACNVVASRIEVGYPPTKIEPIVGHGAERPIMRDWLSFAIATADEAPQIYSYISGCLMTEYLGGPEFLYGSGLQAQGTAYGMVPRLYPNMAMDMLFFSASGKRVLNADLVAPVITAINRIRPDKENLRVGDDYNNTPKKYDMNGVAIMAYFAGSYYKSPIAKAWAYYLGFPVSQMPSELSIPMYLIASDPSVPVDPELVFKPLKLVHYNPYPSGSVVARSAWNDKNAWLTYTNIEEFGTENHDHKDSGTFQIYYKGILAPDTGMYEHNHQYYATPYHYGYVKQTISKNGILVFNPATEDFGNWRYSGGQRAQSDEDTWAPLAIRELKLPRYNRGEVIGYSSAENADGSFNHAYLAGDITDSYYKDTVKQIIRSTMTLPTNDPEHPMVFLVYDKVTSMKPEYRKSVLLHTMTEPKFNGGKSVAAPKGEDAEFTYIEGADSFFYDNTRGAAGAFDKPDEKYNGKLTVRTLLPENPVYRYIGGDGKRFWVRGMNVGTENPELHPVGEIGWGRVEISPKHPAKTDYFLNVMYVGDAKDENGNPTSNELVPASLVRSLTHDGAVCFGKCVMFAKGKERICLPFGFKTEGDGVLSYYVTGLAEGKWSITAGEKAQTVSVTDEGGVAIFDAPAGEIALSFKG